MMLLEKAKQAIFDEAKALAMLGEGLGESFLQIVEILANLKGRTILCGMGKSGHVARKVAATFASTGTPAFFVHPAEASHGDLGMITQEDGILVFSVSGRNQELFPVLEYARRCDIPLIGISQAESSPLAQYAKTTLFLPPYPEVCPHGLAPTTSTTMMMALGDALAITLMERRGFSSTDFRIFHPGGSLGKKILKVSDLMHTGDELPTAYEHTPMAEALEEMSRKGFGCVGIINPQGTLIGIITDGDIRRHIAHNFLDKSPGDIMTRNPVSVSPQDLAVDVLALFQNRRITMIFAVDTEYRPVGVLNIHECLRAGLL